MMEMIPISYNYDAISWKASFIWMYFKSYFSPAFAHSPDHIIFRMALKSNYMHLKRQLFNFKLLQALNTVRISKSKSKYV